MSRNIMIVDDESAITRMLGALIARSLKAEVRAYNDPLRSREEFDKDPAWPNLIICDLRMPGLDGMALCRLFRARRTDVPIVILTAYAGDEVRREALEIGIRHLVSKPFTPKPFLELIESLLTDADSGAV